MSGDGPESIPTSADPRSHRPTKKRALSPASAQAASLSLLLAHPERDIRLPPTISPLNSTSDPNSTLTANSNSTSRRNNPLPPDIISNVQGSSAGAGSGEFHVYKAARRREFERMRQMDEDLRRDRDAEAFAREKAERDRRDDDKTRKNRDKRLKAKARKSAKAPPAAGTAAPAPASKAQPSQQSSALDSATSNHHPGRTSAPDSRMPPPAAPHTPGLIIHADDDD